MRRYFLFFGMIFLISQGIAAQTPPTVNIVSSSGGFSVTRDDIQKNYSIADVRSTGMVLQKGDIVQTESTTKVVVEIKNTGVKFDIRENTSIKFLQVGLDGNIHSVNIIYGRMLVTNMGKVAQVVYIEAGSTATEFYSGILSVDFTIPANRMNVKEPTLTLASMKGDAILVPDIKHPDSRRTNIQSDQMAVLSNSKKTPDVRPVDESISEFWYGPNSSEKLSTGTAQSGQHPQSNESMQPSQHAQSNQPMQSNQSGQSEYIAAGSDIDELTEEQRLRLRLITKSGKNDGVTIDVKTGGMIVGLSLFLAGVIMQTAGHFMATSNPDDPMGDTLFMVGFAPVALGSFVTIADILYKPKKQMKY
ncbi:MAG: hypothetical protein Ta2G_14350 [Termitinemataceae bacterium]|nr:MAG: hypothetical protein Ta2G_14350 [Termitinemataceae bacterium]